MQHRREGGRTWGLAQQEAAQRGTERRNSQRDVAFGHLPADRVWGAAEMIVAEAGGWEVSHYFSLVLILTLM